MKKDYKKIFLFIIAILFGIFMFVYGERDDSPGGQLLGLVSFIVGIMGLVKSKKKASKLNSPLESTKNNK